MVDKIQYRWDFIGLSTDTKPTPETNDRVANGSTFYCSDNSKLYVWYKDQWYEKTVSGGGGGGSYTAGDGIDITNNTISVDTDTIQEKLTAGTGIDITGNTISATGGSGPTVVQTIGSSTTDVMSQNATTSMVYVNPASLEQIRIGKNASASGSVSVAIGYGTSAGQTSSVAIGRNATTTRNGEMNIGTGSYNNGYNSTPYRVLGGVHDPVDAHDAATKGYVDNQARFFNIADIVYDAYMDPEAQKTITLQEYEALEEACMDYLPLAYYRLEVDVYEFVLLPHYDCLPSTSINVYGETTSFMGSFHFEYNDGQPYVVFNQ